MKTSIVAVVGAGLFLIAAFLGVGSSPHTVPAPQMIVVAGASPASVATPSPESTPSLPAVSDTLSGGSSSVLAVGRAVQTQSLQALAASPGATAVGPANVALGQASAAGSANGTLFVHTELSALPSPVSTPQPNGTASPVPGPSPSVPRPLITLPVIPLPVPTPQPTPEPTPSPSPTGVTATATPTSTATPPGPDGPTRFPPRRKT